MTDGILSHDFAGLSYCRHMKKVHHMVSHMVDASVPLQGLDPANYKDGVVEELWTEFQANRNVRDIHIHCACTCIYMYTYTVDPMYMYMYVALG